MTKRIFFILLWVAFIAILHLFGNNVGTFSVLVASISIPIVSGILLLLVPKTTVTLNLPDNCAKGETALGSLSTGHSWVASLYKISCTLICENSFTGEIQEMQFDKIAQTQFALQTNHCGVLHVYIKELQISDPLGIFMRRLSHSAKHHIIIPPAGFATHISLTDAAQNLDSDEYSATKAGMDVSETYAIREYQPGDPKRSIHWKLSEKLDKVMVREFGLPVGNSVLLVLDSAANEEISPSGWDAAAELFFSAGLALLGDGICATMGWVKSHDAFGKYKLHTPDDILAAIQECLLTSGYAASRRKKSGVDFDYPREAYEHILVVTPGDEPSILHR